MMVFVGVFFFVCRLRFAVRCLLVIADCCLLFVVNVGLYVVFVCCLLCVV